MSQVRSILSSLNSETGRIFSLIQKNGPVSKNDIIQRTGHKLTTLNRMMDALEAEGMILPSLVGESAGGRRPVLYGVNALGGYAVGIEISRVYSRVVVADLGMNLLASEPFKMDESCTPEKTVALITSTLQGIFHRLKIDRKLLTGAGVGTVGPLNRETGTFINPQNFPAPGWADVNIREMLEGALQCPVDMDNGANTAILAEWLYGAGKGLDNIAYFNCGIGIRAGAVSSGRIVRAINDSDDAFGHMTIDVDGEPCSCGNYGCIECYSSIHAITRKFKNELKKGRNSSLPMNPEQIDFLDICRGAEKGDRLAFEVIENAAAIFGAGLANFINLLNPELVILSGTLVASSDLFYHKSMEVALKKHYLKENSRAVFHRMGDFREHSIALGASAMVIEKLLNRGVIS